MILLEIPPNNESLASPFIAKLNIDLLDVDESYSDKKSKQIWKVNKSQIVEKRVDLHVNRSLETATTLVSVVPEKLEFRGL